jgi:hypothetical protein
LGQVVDSEGLGLSSLEPRQRFAGTIIAAAASIYAVAALPFSPTIAAEPWIDTQQVGPFVCQATFPLREYDGLLSELPELEHSIDRALVLPPVHEPLYIYLFSDAKSHQQYLQQHFPNVPYRRALFVKDGGLAAVYAYRHDQLGVDLRHECTHALLHANLPTVPLWLDEGLAEYFEVPEDRRGGEHPNFGSLRWNMRLGMVHSMAELEQRQELAEMSIADYRYSWAWVHFMLRGPDEAHGALVAYIGELHQGASAGRLSERLTKSLPDAADRLVQHFNSWNR